MALVLSLKCFFVWYLVKRNRLLYGIRRWWGGRVRVHLIKVGYGKEIVKAESHCNDNENDNMITTQRERILLVELLHAKYAHAYSTNRGRALLTFSFSLSLSGPV